MGLKWIFLLLYLSASISLHVLPVAPCIGYAVELSKLLLGYALLAISVRRARVLLVDGGIFYASENISSKLPYR